jgi:LmbE family N-acetylglucosaminyl deacetylase
LGRPKRGSELDFPPVLNYSKAVERILAVFAHPDDEASCVGTLANHSDAGDAVRLLWLSRGENATTLALDRAEKIRERARQAEKIGALLGAETGFLDFPDAGIVHTRENALVVSEVIRSWKPTIIITWNRSRAVGAGHPDHRNTNAIVLDAVSYARFPLTPGQEVHREHLSIYLTNDACPRYPVRLIDVSHQEQRIRAFFSIYKGMYGAWPVEEMIFANLARSGLTASCRLAEAFQFIQLGKADRLLV